MSSVAPTSEAVKKSKPDASLRFVPPASGRLLVKLGQRDAGVTNCKRALCRFFHSFSRRLLISLPSDLILICALFLISRLVMLNYNQAEFTDGYAFIQWSVIFNPDGSFYVSAKYLPAYPLLLKTLSPFLDPIVSGRLISAFAGLCCVALHYQKDTFADIKETGKYLDSHFPHSNIFSNDQFKESFYAKRDVKRYDPAQHYRSGHIIALHSFYRNLQEQMQLLRARYRMKNVFRAESVVIPLLANTIVTKGSNTPEVASRIFQPQKFTSIVVRIAGRKSPGTQKRVRKFDTKTE